MAPHRRNNFSMLNLVFLDETKNCTVSALRSNNGEFFGFVIEDGFRKTKVYGETRIPPGIFKITKRMWGGFYEKYKKKFRHKYTLEIESVPGFSDILIHIGNKVTDTKGCLLINSGINYVDTDDLYVGSGSTRAYKKLYKWIDKHFKDNDELLISISR